MQGHYIQLILVAVFVGFSVVQWIVRKLAQQRAIKAAQEMEMRMREEALRTGRDPFTGEPMRAVERAPEPASAFAPQATPAPAPQAVQQPDALAQRREQLRRLREQRASMRPEVSSPQAARGQGSPGVAAPASPAGGPVRAELWPGGPTIVINQGAPQASPQSNASPTSNVSRQMERPPDTRRNSPSPQTPAKAAKKARRPSATEQSLRAQAEQSAARSQRPTPMPVPAQTPTPEVDRRPVVRPFAIPQTAAQWRAALVTGEILQPPVTERPPRDF